MSTHDTAWSHDRNIQSFPKLDTQTGAQLQADVVIFGGGITGLLSAYTLAKAGKKVVVLEKHELANGMTMATTAFLTQIIDSGAEDVCKMLGIKKAKAMYASHMSAISLIERIITEEKIDCGWKRVSNYIIATTQNEAEDLEDEYDVLRALDVAVSLHPQNRDFGFAHTALLEVKNQAMFNPLLFISGLVSVLVSLGVQIFEHSPAEDSNVNAPWSITATHQPFNNPLSVFAKKGEYISYVYEFEIPKGKFKEGLYEDMQNPYHYFRVSTGVSHDTVIVGGEDHRKEIPMDREKNWLALKEYADKTFGAGVGEVDIKIVRRWDGIIIESIDGFALIGVVGKSVTGDDINKKQIVATAFSGNGLTYAGITALIARDIIEKGKSQWDPIYKPGRWPSFSALQIKTRDYVGEFIHGALKNSIAYYKKRFK